MEGMRWCCPEFERHLGRLDSDGIRVDFFLKMPPRAGFKLFLLTQQDAVEKPTRIFACPWCGADLNAFPHPQA
jgi:hypothetical protein